MRALCLLSAVSHGMPQTGNKNLQDLLFTSVSSVILKGIFSHMHLNGKIPSIFLVKIFLGYPSGETDPGHTGGIILLDLETP